MKKAVMIAIVLLAVLTFTGIRNVAHHTKTESEVMAGQSAQPKSEIFVTEEVKTEVTTEVTTEVSTETEVKTEVTTKVETTTETEVEEVEEEIEAFIEEEEEEPENQANDYSDDDLDLLAHLIYAEAGDQADDCQRAVGTVVMNRVASPNFPSTMYGVIYQSGQYACTWDGGIYKTPSQQAYDNARWILEGNRYLDPSYVFQAQFEQGYGCIWIGSECFGRE